MGIDLPLLADDQARPRHMEHHLDFIARPLDLNAVDARVAILSLLRMILDKMPDLMIFKQQAGEFLLGCVPAAFPAQHNSGTKTDWIDFLTHDFVAQRHACVHRLVWPECLGAKLR